MDLRDHIATTPDWPQPGVTFRDFTPLLMHAPALSHAIDGMTELVAPYAPDYILAPEARGFMFGAAVAHRVGAGFLPARKPGKLPPAPISQTYTLEYGEAELQIHPFEQLRGARVMLHDDLLATGGTIDALALLAQQAGAEVVGAFFLIELGELGGRDKLAAHLPADAIHALITY